MTNMKPFTLTYTYTFTYTKHLFVSNMVIMFSILRARIRTEIERKRHVLLCRAQHLGRALHVHGVSTLATLKQFLCYPQHTRREDGREEDKTRRREEDKTRQDKTRQDKTRQDKTRQDKTRQDKTRQDKTRQDKTRQDEERREKREERREKREERRREERREKREERREKTRQDKTRQTDKTRQDKTRQDKTRQARQEKRQDKTRREKKQDKRSDVPTRPHREGNGAQHGEQKYRRSAIPFSQTCVVGRSLCQTKMALDCLVSACSHTLRNAVRRRLLDLRQYQHFQSNRHGTEPSSACASRHSEM